MKLKFSKYQGTGNDFVMLDNLSGEYNDLTLNQIQVLCDRKFGVGADGLIKLSKNSNGAFEMDYYNSDGSKSFCGNGARCTIAFAEKLGIDVSDVTFSAIDGIHQASKIDSLISLKMNDVNKIKSLSSDFELNTGSPHYIRFVENSLDINVYEAGRKIRYSVDYMENGINVNFVEILKENEIEVATYERGVEDETLSCGTGVVASALAYAKKVNLIGENEIIIHTKGGKLKVKFNCISENHFENIFLIGPAIHVFDGEMEV
ncbi:MAG: diaminopimelate epimerase [Bacteroidota bacterium]